ncbi:I78 family peptidase inhibitor [Endobacterium cereale]|nr:I78 family peptidase inhibitor [Endobacterium cereale]MEB2843606.1 I78 family peptidase inhibitor [Endobacterium cereale]
MKILVTVFAVLAVAAGAPATAFAAPAKAKLCNAEAAKKLVGKKKPSDARAKRLTGAANVRQIGPGDMVTRDFRQDRVTIETDPATGRVTQASCG